MSESAAPAAPAADDDAVIDITNDDINAATVSECSDDEDSNERQRVRLPNIWEEETVFDRGDGYLCIEHERYPGADKEPLLLFSAQSMLQKMYPDMEIEAILKIDPSEIAIEEPEIVAGEAEESKDDKLDDNKPVDGDGKSQDEPATGEQVVKDREADEGKEAAEVAEAEKVAEGEEASGDGKATKDDEGAKDKDTEDPASKAVYSVYQHLARDTNFSNQIEMCLLDFFRGRHRKGKKEREAKAKELNGGKMLSRNEKRVKALEHEQQRIIDRNKSKDEGTAVADDPGNQEQSDATLQPPAADEGAPDTPKSETGGAEVSKADTAKADNGNGNTDKTNTADGQDQNGKEGDATNANTADADTAADDDDAEGDDDDEESMYDPAHIRLVRTINSIRALAPHLAAAFNHKRNRDKDLYIGDVKYRTKKDNRYWILGINIYDIVSAKRRTAFKAELTDIVAAYVGYNTALSVVDHSFGDPSFWSEQWIPTIQTFAKPQLRHPLEILVSEQQTEKGQKTQKQILKIAKTLDEIDALAKEAPMQSAKSRYDRAINNVHDKIKKLLKDRFAGARLSIYGSCLSDLSLGHGADVDLSLYLPGVERLRDSFRGGKITASKYESSTKQLVYQVCRTLERREGEFEEMVPVPRARVPVVQGSYMYAGNPYSNDGSLKFDICFMNDIAVANSGMIREYSIIDIRVKRLILAVKRWAKEHEINSARTDFISSYAWVNLVIFYLQCHGYLPSLQSKELMKKTGFEPNSENYWHTINDLETYALSWYSIATAGAWAPPQEFIDTPISVLVYGFFHFYSHQFPSGLYAACIKRGDLSLPRSSFHKRVPFHCIEDPFETHDSHCPHDLGTPASEKGARKIFDLMRIADMHLRKVLTGAKVSNGMWPAPPKKQPAVANQGGRGRRGGKQKQQAQQNHQPQQQQKQKQTNARTVPGQGRGGKSNRIPGQQPKSQGGVSGQTGGGRGRGRQRRRRGGRGGGGGGRGGGRGRQG